MSNKVSQFSEIHTPSSYPASEKRYVDGSRAGLRVPYREISLSATNHSQGTEENPPLPVYDTSGAYTDPQATGSTSFIGRREVTCE
jgi:phosphomethylpyrimidine synthase